MALSLPRPLEGLAGLCLSCECRQSQKCALHLHQLPLPRTRNRWQETGVLLWGPGCVPSYQEMTWLHRVRTSQMLSCLALRKCTAQVLHRGLCCLLARWCDACHSQPQKPENDHRKGLGQGDPIQQARTRLQLLKALHVVLWHVSQVCR
jgi:hypothetical protein